MKRYTALADKKGRLEAGLFLVEGPRAIRQIISSRADAVVEIIASPEQAANFRGYPVRLATPRQCESICHTKTPQGALAVVRLPQDLYGDRLPRDVGSRVLLLENIQDPGNVGALIRTAAAFEYSVVILSEACADPFAPKSVQASSGTILSIAIRRTSAYLDLLRTLKDRGYLAMVADVRGEDVPLLLQRRDRLVFALGNETAGPSASLIAQADHRIRIPIREERAESLNVAACGAIGMYLSSGLH